MRWPGQACAWPGRGGAAASSATVAAAPAPPLSILASDSSSGHPKTVGAPFSDAATTVGKRPPPPGPPFTPTRKPLAHPTRLAGGPGGMGTDWPQTFQAASQHHNKPGRGAKGSGIRPEGAGVGLKSGAGGQQHHHSHHSPRMVYAASSSEVASCGAGGKVPAPVGALVGGTRGGCAAGGCAMAGCAAGAPCTAGRGCGADARCGEVTSPAVDSPAGPTTPSPVDRAEPAGGWAMQESGQRCGCNIEDHCMHIPHTRQLTSSQSIAAKPNSTQLPFASLRGSRRVKAAQAPTGTKGSL